jgi:2-octaprenyl-6-methoxyphenol hydroxylase
MIAQSIIIAGAGPAGLLAGVALRRAGFSITIIDPKPLNAFIDGRTIALTKASSAYLKSLKVWDALVSDASPIQKIIVQDGTAACSFEEEQPLGYIVPMASLRAALLAQVEDAVRTDRIIGHNGTTVSCASGTTQHANVLVAVDGKQSRLRAQAGIGIRKHAYPETALVVEVAHSQPHHGVAFEHFLASGPLALLPLQGNRSTLVWSLPTTTATHLSTIDEHALASGIKRAFGDALGDFTINGKRWLYPLNCHYAESLYHHRLVLLGEAAHAMHPIAGQGFNISLRDVQVLTTLCQHQAAVGLDIGSRFVGKAYQENRLPDITAMLVATHGLSKIFNKTTQPLALMRKVGLYGINNNKVLKKLFINHATGFSLLAQLGVQPGSPTISPC